MKNNLKIMLAVTIASMSVSGCVKPYEEPEFVVISPSQTAYMIPLVGDISNQSAFESEELLSEYKVATKEIEVPKRWVQTGRRNWQGEYRATATIITVERQPETREWTESTSNGTSNANQGITAESKESTSFMARMNISAQIEEKNASLFLYRYNNTGLSTVLDTEIRAKVESYFVEECAKRTMDEILNEKSEIMSIVSDNVINYFAQNGITITTLGLKGEFTYLNQDIQDSIDRKFQSAQDLITQQNENEKNISKAEADAEVIRLQSENYDNLVKMKEIENQTLAIEKWDGVLPITNLADSVPFINVN